VLEARVLSRSPNGLRLFLKLQRRVIVSATYNTEHDVSYRAHGTGRARRWDRTRCGAPPPRWRLE
jgi:hypothetical protein